MWGLCKTADHTVEWAEAVLFGEPAFDELQCSVCVVCVRVCVSHHSSVTRADKECPAMRVSSESDSNACLVWDCSLFLYLPSVVACMCLIVDIRGPLFHP